MRDQFAPFDLHNRPFQDAGRPYSRIENQNTRIDISRLISISKILGVTLIGLLEFDENNINTLLMNNTETAKKELPKEQVYLVSRVKNLEEKIDLIQEIILINGK